MIDWMLPRITDYWDCRVNAIQAHSQRLAALARDDWPEHAASIAGSVGQHLDVLSQDQRITYAWVMVDDVYRTAVQSSYWSDSLRVFLQASCGPVLRSLSALGYALRYFIDNEFEGDDLGLLGPSVVFPLWFRAAGFAYVCPQELAYHAVHRGARRADSWTVILPEYIDDARRSAHELVARANAVHSHVVYLDADSNIQAGDFAAKSCEAGTVWVFRNQAPHLSSRVIVKVSPPVT